MNLLLSFDQLMDLLGANPLRWSGVILGSVCGLMLVLHYLVRTLNDARFAWQRRLRLRLGVAPGKRIGELRWWLLSVHLLVWPLVAYLLLRIWGLHDEGRDLVSALFSRGLTIGSIAVVPGKLLFGLLAFMVLFTFTRWLKKKIEYDWLTLTGIEHSTREAVGTLFGYATFIIAAIIGLSSAGLDFTKLAIVAGALSVGVGFGLQTIVNNFVSGLILMFERPVRSGDYVFVGQTQGFVRKIRIRSTEIESWDRETIIVPNSDLLNSHLRNLNLRDQYGRITIPIGVAYGSDTELVRSTLLEVALGHTGVIREGQVRDLGDPSVLFVDFGDSSLNFELRAYVFESTKRLAVASDLRFAIDAAFRKAGIDIPFPQRDVWVRGLPAQPQATPTPTPEDGKP